MASPFDVLGIDSDADDADIVRAYRQRVLETHPDQGGSAREFQLVRAAYEQIQARIDGADPGGEGAQVEEPQMSSRVEYLDYEVLDDHGWELDDDDLFEKASAAGLDPSDYGRIVVQPDESLLEAAEKRGFAWPFACRGGACANCAVVVMEGELAMPVNHILPSEMMERDIRLSCNGIPLTEEMKIVYNVKYMTDLYELRLPPHPFKQAYRND